jgi:sigma-B regulation protein RsbU (phosphoserine phosphatase)
VGEVVRGRTYRRRFIPERGNPGMVLTSLNRILHERGLEEYYCTLCYTVFDFKKRTATFGNSGLPFPLHVSGDAVRPVDLPGVPLGSFGVSTYDEVTVDLTTGDVFVFFSDGISETFSAAGDEFGSGRVGETALAYRDKPAKDIVQAIFGAMQAFRGDAPQTDDQTVVVVKITG